MAKIVYRYDNEFFSDGQIIRSRGDFFPMLSAVEKTVELLVRQTMPNGSHLRPTSLYTWENLTITQRLWRSCGKKYLYELQVEEGNIRHIGDLDWYSAAKDAVIKGESAQAAVNAYCSGENAPPVLRGPRREVLVIEAVVMRKIASR